ncbi:zeta toxin family protein [Enterococcus sp. AZ196]|uniref:zeta toxin family protein n=1 Tax=Enterococcus sp. AZ196 TaxID=2774659 RepID=UPI003D27B4FF
MNDPQSFTEKEFETRFRKNVYLLTKNKFPVQNPNGFLLGGQPGAGKSTLHNIVKSQMQGNIVTIDNDLFKQQHPNFDELVKLHGKEYVSYVTPYSNRMTEELIKYLSDRKFNLTIEGTLRTVNVPLNTINQLIAKDYTVNLYVMAVAKELSYLGTLERYENMFSVDPINARFTDKAIHDDVVSNLPKNIDTLFKSNKLTDIRLFQRDGSNVFSLSETPSDSPKNALDEILNQSDHQKQTTLSSEIDQRIKSLKELFEKNGHLTMPEAKQFLLWAREFTERAQPFSIDRLKQLDSKIKNDQQQHNQTNRSIFNEPDRS